MTEQLTENTVNRTRWGRTSALMVGGVATTAAIGASLLSQGVYASEFVAAGADSDVIINELTTTHNSAFVRGMHVKNFDGSPGIRWVATFQVPHATADGLCLTHAMEFLGQPMTLYINIAGAKLDVTGINVDIPEADTDLTLRGNTNLGKAPSLIEPAIRALGAPSVAYLNDDDGVGIEAEGGAVLRGAKAKLLSAEIIKATDVETLDARLIPGDATC
ncbi:MAG: hypothetical protein LLG14_00695 [Nocardiaceae bacterium]|nr:hypothetical protein [Nocardiaceae bacterium]